jgi:hypothetical protein
VVHHLNGNPSDDRAANLVVTQSQSAHQIVHAIDKAAGLGYDFLTQKRCSICKLVKLRTEFSPSSSRGRKITSHACKSCAASFQRQYRKDHPDRIRRNRRANGKRG